MALSSSLLVVVLLLVVSSSETYLSNASSPTSAEIINSASVDEPSSPFFFLTTRGEEHTTTLREANPLRSSNLRRRARQDIQGDKTRRRILQDDGSPAAARDHHSQRPREETTSSIDSALFSFVVEQNSEKKVLPEDTILLPPPYTAPLIAPIVAYAWRRNSDWPADQYQRPIYQNLDARNEFEFWNYVVDELLLARVPVALLHGRGCTHTNITGGENHRRHFDLGPGGMCPRMLRKFVAALRRATTNNNATPLLKFGMFDATGAYPRNANVARLDLAQQRNWKYFWNHNIQIWFDTIPRDWWFLLNHGTQPVICAWTLSDAFFTNQRGNASKLLQWLKDKFKARYGLDPAFILQDSWFEQDSTITQEHATGRHGWFSPQHDDRTSVVSYRNFAGQTWGVTTPGYRNGYSYPNCTHDCRHVTRRNGTTLANALAMATQQNFPVHAQTTGTVFESGNCRDRGREIFKEEEGSGGGGGNNNDEKAATMIMLEGWNDMVESAGFYRSHHWDYPTQYINVVRQFADPTPTTIRFQAEGADAYSDVTVANEGRQYSSTRSLDVGALPDGSGWYVGWVHAGEWLEYQHVQLGCGRYRFTARIATRHFDKQLHLEIYHPDSGELEPLTKFPSVVLPNTGGMQSYQLVHLGQVRLRAGMYHLRLVMDTTDGLNIDWFFLKKHNVTWNDEDDKWCYQACLDEFLQDDDDELFGGAVAAHQPPQGDTSSSWLDDWLFVLFMIAVGCAAALIILGARLLYGACMILLRRRRRRRQRKMEEEPDKKKTIPIVVAGEADKAESEEGENNDEEGDSIESSTPGNVRCETHQNKKPRPPAVSDDDATVVTTASTADVSLASAESRLVRQQRQQEDERSAAKTAVIGAVRASLVRASSSTVMEDMTTRTTSSSGEEDDEDHNDCETGTSKAAAKNSAVGTCLAQDVTAPRPTHDSSSAQQQHSCDESGSAATVEHGANGQEQHDDEAHHETGSKKQDGASVHDDEEGAPKDSVVVPANSSSLRVENADSSAAAVTAERANGRESEDDQGGDIRSENDGVALYCTTPHDASDDDKQNLASDHDDDGGGDVGTGEAVGEEDIPPDDDSDVDQQQDETGNHVGSGGNGSGSDSNELSSLFDDEHEEDLVLFDDSDDD